MWGGFRDYMADGILTDIDIVNCHPCLVLNLCDQFNIDAPNLKSYINNRDQLFKQYLLEHKCRW